MIRRVDPVRAWLADERVVEAQRACIQILLIERIGEVLPVREILDPRPNDVTPLAGALEKQPRVADAIPTLRIALGVEGVEILLAVEVAVEEQPQVSRRKVEHTPVDIDTRVVVGRLDELISNAADSRYTGCLKIPRRAK
jgi:hypothetical protein